MRRPFFLSLFACGVMALAGLFAIQGKSANTALVVEAPDLSALLADEFGSWRRVTLADVVLPPEAKIGPGEAVAYRAYADDLGRVITLVVAYGPPKGDSVRLHRPETCYRAQGFDISGRSVGTVGVPGRNVPVVRLDANRFGHREAVTYLLRQGDRFPTAETQRQLFSILGGSMAQDGVLVRVSTANSATPMFDLHDRFISDFIASLDVDARQLVLGLDERKDGVS